ncbi:MAG TPA: hypothetical protein VGK46_05175 [Saprospiraceae bacterium]|jgi:hypothetical protein
MKYFIGIVFIIFAYIFSIYFLYSDLLFYSIFIYLIGVAGILLSSKKTIYKLITIVVPIILWIPIIWLIFQVAIYLDKTHQKIDLIVSEKYNGYVIIVNGVPCAKPFPRLKERDQLEIPNSGVILNKQYADINETWYNYYGKSSNGQRFKIYPSWTRKSMRKKSKDEDILEVHSMGRSGLSLMVGDSLYKFTITTMYIGNTLTEEFYNSLNGTERQHQVIDSLLERCLLGK